MLRQVLIKLKEYKAKYGRYPEYININKRQYRKLKMELSIVEEITEDIRELYFIDFRMREVE